MKKWIPLVLIAITVGFTLSVYDQLPLRVVTHWGVNGPNGWSSRDIAAWFGPALATFLWLVLTLVPRIDPRRANYEKFQGGYDTLIVVSVAIACIVHFAVLGFALGWPININQLVPVLVGALFLFFGWLLPRAKSNFFVGVRTPWTLSSDQVWQRTHRLAGFLFLLAGIIVMSLAFVRDNRDILRVMIVVGIIVLIPIPYSYIIWRGEKG